MYNFQVCKYFTSKNIERTTKDKMCFVNIRSFVLLKLLIKIHMVGLHLDRQLKDILLQNLPLLSSKTWFLHKPLKGLNFYHQTWLRKVIVNVIGICQHQTKAG